MLPWSPTLFAKIIFAAIIGYFIIWLIQKALKIWMTRKIVDNQEKSDSDAPKTQELQKEEPISKSEKLSMDYRREFENFLKQKSHSPATVEELSDSDDTVTGEDGKKDGKVDQKEQKITGRFGNYYVKKEVQIQKQQNPVKMSEEEIEMENRMKRSQMEGIMKLMLENKEKFEMTSEEIEMQTNKYYRFE